LSLLKGTCVVSNEREEVWTAKDLTRLFCALTDSADTPVPTSDISQTSAMFGHIFSSVRLVHPSFPSLIAPPWRSALPQQVAMLILLSLHFLKQHRLNFEVNKTPPSVPAFRLPCNGFYLEEHRENRPPLRLWRMRPYGIAFRMPTKTKSGVICTLDFQRMSDVTDQYLLRFYRWRKTNTTRSESLRTHV
jgi:hypothetical protein